jgi:hypothetical protein
MVNSHMQAPDSSSSSSRVEMEIVVLNMVAVLVMVLTSIIDSLGSWHCLLGLYMDWPIGIISV